MATGRGRTTHKSLAWIVLMVLVVFILILITIGIVALRVGNSLPENTDILFIVGKSPSFDIEDSEGKKWSTQKKVNIFKSEYVNGNNEATVVSQEGTKVFAPGTSTKYVFTLQNNGNMAVVYETDMLFTLTMGDEEMDSSEFPVKVRLHNDSGEYMIGSSTEYVQIKNATFEYHPGLLGANSYENYTLELYWAYEGGDDEMDTWLGNNSVGSDVVLSVTLQTYAEEAPDPTSLGGTKVETDNEEFGGTTRWLWFILLMVFTAILILYIIWLINRYLNKKYEHHDE